MVALSRHEGGFEGAGERAALHLMSEMIKLPIAIFVYTMEMVVATMQGVQRMGADGMDRLVDGLEPAPRPAAEPPAQPFCSTPEPNWLTPAPTVAAPPGVDTPPAGAPAVPGAQAAPADPGAEPLPALSTSTPGVSHPDAGTHSKEDRAMRDTNLADDMVKLVRYSILSIQRDDEHVLGEISGNSGGRTAQAAEERAMAIATGKAPSSMPVARGEIVVTENMTDDAFSAWMISNYFEQPNHEAVAVEDRKYLRVCYEVLGRWPAQDRRYEEYQLKFLGGIEEALSKIAASK